MKTILYNTITKEIKHHKPKGYYKVNGARPTLSNNWVELEFIRTSRPTVLSTEIINSRIWTVDLVTKTYTLVWTVRLKTQLELDNDAWQYPDYEIKLEIIKNWIFTPKGAQYINYFNLLECPMVFKNNKIHVWAHSLAAINNSGANSLNSSINKGDIILYNRP